MDPGSSTVHERGHEVGISAPDDEVSDCRGDDPKADALHNKGKTDKGIGRPNVPHDIQLFPAAENTCADRIDNDNQRNDRQRRHDRPADDVDDPAQAGQGIGNLVGSIN